MNWYEENIEEGIRDIVKLLRDNGINTECSCEHTMYVQFQVTSDMEAVSNVDNILTSNGYENFKIEVFFERMDLAPFISGTVYFPIDKIYPVQEEQRAALEQYFMSLNNEEVKE